MVQICMHNVMSASGGEAPQHQDAVQGITHPDVRSEQSLPLRWVDGYKTLGPLRAQLRTWSQLVYPQRSRPTWTSARCWRRPTGQGCTPCRDITSMSPVADWDSTRDQLSALLLLFCCYCEQTKFLVATVSRHYFYLQSVSRLYCLIEVIVSFWKHYLFLRETLKILTLLASLSYQLVWVKIKFSKNSRRYYGSFQWKANVPCSVTLLFI